MKKILIAALVMISLSVTASAQKVSDKPGEKNRIEKTCEKDDGRKFDKSKFGKYDGRKKMWKRHSGKKGFAYKHGNRKMQGKKFRNGHASQFKGLDKRGRS